MKIGEYRKLVAYALTSMATLAQMLSSLGWAAFADPTFISLLATILVGGYAVFAAPNDAPENLMGLVDKDTDSA